MLRSIRRYLRSIAPLILGRGGRKGAEGGSEPELTGAPARLRLKTYSGASGFVYQYVYRGERPASGGTAYVFKIGRERGEWKQVEVVVENAVVDEWERREDHKLRKADRYAVAKLTLFEFFDGEAEAGPATTLRPDLNDLQQHLTTLGLI